MALDSSSYRRQDLLPHLSPNAAPPPRRATVSTPAPSFPFSNTLEMPRPHSRTSERYSSTFDRPYPYRRSTISHGQGHNVNDAPQLTARADETMMWSSASSSPIIAGAVIPGLHGPNGSPAPSSSCAASPKLGTHPVFEYDHLSAFGQSPLQPAFTLCPSPEFPNSIDHPRTMPAFVAMHPPPSAGGGRPGSHTTTASTTPALSPAASSTFALDAPVDPSNHNAPPSPPHYNHTSGRNELHHELSRLRGRVRELEFNIRFNELESTDVKARVHADIGLGLDTQEGPSNPHQHHPNDTSFPSSSSATPTPASNPFAFLAAHNDTPNLGPSPPDWDIRTAARLKRFCALNRAGNALCAWHDSRRERRAFPPRMAPPQTLNCGCSFEEALFEESLARNGVGSFYPGEHVRMDPALRNPLLRLLQERYNYRDGDFERTPNGGWREGEDGHSWEQKAANSSRSARRER